MQVCLLSADYLSPTESYSRILVGRRREAPALFKNGKKYYLITSSCTGWSPNAASVCGNADRPMGPFKEIGNPCQGPGAETTFNAQSTFVLPSKDEPNSYMFMADRWNKLDLPKSDYLWLPLTVDKGKVIIKEVTGLIDISAEMSLKTWTLQLLIFAMSVSAKCLLHKVILILNKGLKDGMTTW